ncbi:MAG TPA: hypothetical protein VF271_08025 [Rhodanobacteraceae bacterium]
MTAIHVPEHLRILGSECARLHALIKQSMAADVPAIHPLSGSFPIAARGVARRLKWQARGVVRIFNSSLAAQAGSSRGNTKAVYRLSRRLERVLEDMLDSFHAVRNMDVDASNVWPRQLLMQALREVIEHIGDTLKQLGNMIDYPQAFATPDASTGSAIIRLQMTIDCPPALKKLYEMLQTPSPLSSAPTTPSGTKCALLALGAWLGVNLFGDNGN